MPKQGEDGRYGVAKKQLEVMVEDGDFAQVVEKKNMYYSVIEEMKKETDRIKIIVEKANLVKDKVVYIQPQKTELLGKRVRDMITNCIQVDGSSAVGQDSFGDGSLLEKR